MDAEENQWAAFLGVQTKEDWMKENSDGWLVAWGLCECMLVSSFAVWLLPFTLL